MKKAALPYATFAVLAAGALLGSSVASGSGRDGARPAERARERAIALRSGEIDTGARLRRVSDLMLMRGRGAAGGRVVIQLDGPITPERREVLEAAGVRLGAYLSNNAYVARLTGGARAQSLDGLGFVRFGEPFRREWKIDPDIGLRPRGESARELAQRDRIAVNVFLFEDADPMATLGEIVAIDGAEVTTIAPAGRETAMTVTLGRASVGSLADVEGVRFVEEALEATLRRNNTTRPVVQSGTNTLTPLYANGLTGVGQIVGMQDGGIDISHCSFAHVAAIGPSHRKILALNGTLIGNSHGTHVAATIAGDPGSFTDNRGVAYGAKLVHNSQPGYLNGVEFYGDMELHHQQGARIHSNSWGADFQTEYNAWTQAVDAFSHDYETSMVIFATSNQPNLYTPENAKNGLAVGGTEDWPNINAHETGGVGPTEDGRRKPEVMAPGVNTSARWNTACATTTQTGTSFAAPAVAGVAALVREYFGQGYYPTGVRGENAPLGPSGALLRAMLINSAQDMTSIAGYPSNLEGWGRVVADASLYFPGDARKLIVRDVLNVSDGALSTGEAHDFEFDVVSSGEQLRVTMTFTDPPATVGVSLATPGAAVVNDIDLVIESPSGAIYLGNAFAGGASVTGGSRDGINTTEQVHVNAPEAGRWTARIEGTAVALGKQGFAVVITGDVADVLVEEPECLGDVTGDDVVDFSDLNVILIDFGAVGAGLIADADGDGRVDFSDLNIVLANFGLVCE